MTLPFPLTRPGPTLDALRQLLDAERRKAETEAKRRYGLPLDSEELPIRDPSFSNTMLPTMRTTAEAPQAAVAGAARLMMPELQGTPAVTRRVLGVGETLADMAKQPAAAAAGLTARLGEGGARTIAGLLPDGSAMQQRLERAGDTIAEANRETQQSLAPHSALANIVRVPSEIGVSALPYMAAGGGLLGLLRSAAMTGIESRATDGSLVEGLANMTGSDALRNLADSKYKVAADVGVDLLANIIPELKPAMRAAARDVRHSSNMAGITERLRRNEIATVGADEAAKRQARLDARGVPAARQQIAAYGETAERMPRASAVDEAFKQRVADWFERTKSNPNDPATVRAYRAFADETRKQFEHLQKQGVKFEFVDNPAPYANSAEMMRDIAENNRLVSYKTPETDFHPLLSAEENDMFRAVHDYFGHAGHGNQFGQLGEENAYRVHSAMFSPEARRAMATETRGQNSWVNTRPENKVKPGSVYADQKVTVMPESLMGLYPSEQQLGAAAGRGPLRDEAAVRLAQLTGGARQVGRNVRNMAKAGAQELRQNPRQAAALLALLGEGVVPGSSAFAGPLMVGSTGRVPVERWTPTSRLFDREGVPDMQGTLEADPRLAMEQYVGPRAKPSELVEAIASSKVVPRVLDEDAERGLIMGGPTWYDLGPIRNFFEQRLGLKDFEDWNTIGSAASASNSVPAEISAASIINFARKNDMDLETAKRIARDMFKIDDEPGKLPLIYQSHADRAARGINEGHVILPEDLGSDAWKIPGYQIGRRGGGTTDKRKAGSKPAIDRHEKYRLVQAAMQDRALRKLLKEKGLDKPGASLPLRNAADYALIGNLYADGANRMGLKTPQAYQASRWTGGFDMTGLQSPYAGDFTQAVEDMVLFNAQQRKLGTSRKDLQQLFEDVARGTNMLMPWLKEGPIPIRE